MAQVAFTAYVPHNYPADLEPGLEASAFYDPANFTFPAGTHIAEVEIDADTGVTTLVNWVAVDDFGKVVNPMIVEGQVHRSEEHTSELQSLMRISYAVFCLKKKKTKTQDDNKEPKYLSER